MRLLNILSRLISLKPIFFFKNSKSSISTHTKKIPRERSPIFHSFYGHVRLTNRKGVNIALFQVCQRMVNKPMSCLIRAHSVDHIKITCILRKTPIILRNFRCLFICPFRELPRLDLMNKFRTSVVKKN